MPQRGLVDRVREILLRPRQEWQVIEPEQTDLATLYRGYVVPLAAIGPIASAIGALLFGFATPGAGTAQVSVRTAVAQAIVGFLLSLVSTYVSALIIDRLAPRFGGNRSMPQALKVSAYSSTTSACRSS